MKLQVLTLFLFTFFNTGCSQQDFRQSKIELLLSDLFRQHLFNGAIVISEKGKIIFSKGYGYANFEDSIPFTPHTSSDGGSNAKTLTGTAILLLAEEGRLKLSDSIQRYIPGYPYPNTKVWNLITHSTGGLPDYDYFFQRVGDSQVVTTSSNLDIINRNKPSLSHLPGANFHYDNVAFDLAALIIERVTGKSYEQFLREKFLIPLGMDSSFIRPARFSDWKQTRTIGYEYVDDSIHLLDIADREGFYGGCNIWFTTNDLYRWGQSFYYKPIFSKELIETATSNVVINERLSQVRLGAWYPGKTTTAFYYWGNVAGFYSWVYWDSEKEFTIAFMTNSNMPQWVRPLLTSSLINILSGDKSSPIVEPPAESIERDSLQQIIGTYEVSEIGKIEISVRGSKPIMKLSNGMEYQMHLVDQKRFYVPGYDPWISFRSLQNGRFQQLYWSSTVLQTTGKRISIN